MGLRTINDPVPEGERVFMQASDAKAYEEGDVPVRVKNFSKGGEDDG